MHIRPVEPFGVIPRRLMVGRLQADQSAKLGAMVGGQIEGDAPAHGTAHDHRFVQFQRGAESTDDFGVAVGGEGVLLILPADRRWRLAAPWQVEGEHAETVGDRRVGHQMAKLTGVAAGGVQADQRDAAAGFLEIQAHRPALPGGPQIAPDDRFELRAHRPLPSFGNRVASRGKAIISLKYLKFDMNGSKSPSRTA